MTSQTLNPKVVALDEVSVLNFPGGEQISIPLSREDTGGAFTLFRGTMPPNAGSSLHVHRFEDEVIYILQGEITIKVGDDSYTAKAGTVALLPKGIPHAHHNHSDQEAHIFVIATPSGFEGFITESFALMTAAEPDMEALGALSAKYGIEMTGNPAHA